MLSLGRIPVLCGARKNVRAFSESGRVRHALRNAEGLGRADPYVPGKSIYQGRFLR